MEIIRPDFNVEHSEDIPSVFLAGPIQGAPAWDEKLCDELSDCCAVAYNPRRLSMDSFVYEHQVEWETKHLMAADIISFTFAHESAHVPGRSYAQTSRFELGEVLSRAKYSGKTQKVVVYCPEDFPGCRYFNYKIEKEYPDVALIVSDWEEYVELLRGLLLS